MKTEQAQKIIKDLIKMTYSKEAPCLAAVHTLNKYKISGQFMDLLIADFEKIIKDAKEVRTQLKY